MVGGGNQPPATRARDTAITMANGPAEYGSLLDAQQLRSLRLAQLGLLQAFENLFETHLTRALVNECPILLRRLLRGPFRLNT